MKAGLYCFAWDFADEGVDNLLDWCADTGITHLFFAATYHSGWFLHGHNPKHKTYMPASGAVYFHPTAELYGRIQPSIAPLCQERDLFREVCDKAPEYGLQIVAWVVGAHNTLQGKLHPDCCVTNCFGDVYPHNLCPAHPDVWHYLMALCSDIGSNFKVAELTLESFGYGGWKHNHQHERDFHGLNDLEAGLMSLCFNPATMNVARAAGIDGEAVRAGVAGLLRGVFDFAPDRPAGHPTSWEEAEAAVPALADYRAAMNDTDRRLEAAATAAMAPAACHTTSLGGYGKDAAFVREKLPVVREKAGANPVWVSTRLSGQETPSQAFLSEFVGATREGGADGIVFYNYSEAPRRTLEWLKTALGES